MMKFPFTLIVLLRLYASLFAQPYFISQSNRVRDSIGLLCGNGSMANYIDVETDRTVSFWLNRSEGVRPTPDFETNLDARLDVTLIRNDDELRREARFLITPELEGHYSCGVAGRGESAGILLISTERGGIQETRQFVHESGTTATIPCPIPVGRLRDCYFGRWYKDDVNILKVESPAVQCQNPQTPITLVDREYMLDSTFSLIIPNVTPLDTGTYTCEISALFPATSSPTPYGRSLGQSLSVDEAPAITDTPEDFVVGVDEATKTLSSVAKFYCTVAGVPKPVVEWSYLASLTGRNQILDGIASVNETEMGMDDGGRTIVRSTLVFHSLTPRDGGVVTCTANSRVGHNSASAQLTVLGAPSKISTVTSLDGTILYEIPLPVTLNRPTHLNFTYINSRNPNEISSPERQPQSAVMEFNNLDQIYHRENIMNLPFPKFYLNISLYVAKGSQIIQGPFATTSEPIDSEEPSLRTVIGLAAGLGGSVLLLVTVFIVVITCVYTYFIQQRNKIRAAVHEGVNKTGVKVDAAGRNIDNINRVIDRLDEADQKQLNDELRTFLSQLKADVESISEIQKEIRTAADDGELTGKEAALSRINQFLSIVPDNATNVGPNSTCTAASVEEGTAALRASDDVKSHPSPCFSKKDVIDIDNQSDQSEKPQSGETHF